MSSSDLSTLNMITKTYLIDMPDGCDSKIQCVGEAISPVASDLVLEWALLNDLLSCCCDSDAVCLTGGTAGTAVQPGLFAVTDDSLSSLLTIALYSFLA